MLKQYMISGIMEAGCDEAGRGPLAGSVFAAAVILPPDFHNELLNDSKQLTEHQRYQLRPIIEREALAWAVAEVSAAEIDSINILRSSILGMQRALDALPICPQHILVDGNKWRPYCRLQDEAPAMRLIASSSHMVTPADCPMAALLDGDRSLLEIPADTVVHGDATYMSIAAASILAKTYRDDYMMRLHEEYPQYGWAENKGYPTKAHYDALRQFGPTPYHRMTFNLKLDAPAETPKKTASKTK